MKRSELSQMIVLNHYFNKDISLVLDRIPKMHITIQVNL